MTSSNDPSNPADPLQLAARVNDLEARTKQLDGAMSFSNSTRGLIMLAFVGFVAVAGWKFYSLGDMIRRPEYQKQLLSEVQKSINENHDEYTREVTKLVTALTPVVQSSFSEQAQKDAPVYMKTIDEQREKLIESLQKKMSIKVENYHHGLIQKYENLFAEQFPSLKDKEIRDQMVENTWRALDQLVQKFYIDEFKKEFKAMEVAWADFPPADVPAANDPPLDSQLVGELVDLLAIKFSRGHRSLARE